MVDDGVESVESEVSFEAGFSGSEVSEAVGVEVSESSVSLAGGFGSEVS